MPIKLGIKATDKYFVIGIDDAGNVGTALLAGQKASVVSADPATIVTVDDPTAQPTDSALVLADGTAVPQGTATQLSGTISVATTPAQPNVAVNVTLHLQNADGTPVLDSKGAAIPDVVDTATFVPSLPALAKEGLLFDPTA
jgi:hypothetical protein